MGAGRSGNFRLPKGLPDEALLLLSKDGEALDYRWLGPRYGRTPDLEEAPPDLPTLVRARIQLGEGPTVEYKRELPTTRHQKYNVLKTVVAFATQSGGTVVFGVGEKGEHEEGEIVGLGSTQGVREMLHDMIRSQVTPEPTIDVQLVELGGKKVAALFVGSSGSIHSLDRDGPKFFVRRGSTTFPATHADVNELFEAKAVAQRPADLNAFSSWPHS